MKLIRKIIFIFVIISSIIIMNSKTSIKKKLDRDEEAVDSELIFLEKLYTLDTSIKNESQKKQNNENSGFEEFDNPVTKVSRKEDSMNSNHKDQDTLKDEHEDKFNVGNNSNTENIDNEKDNFKNEKEIKNNINIENDDNPNFMELSVKTNAETSNAVFFKNKLDEINKLEVFLFDQEKKLEQKSRELLERTKSFLK
jgi:hypothetical protein